MLEQDSMRAVVFKGVRQVAVENHPVPKIQDPRDAIVKVSVAALCDSDLHWYRGHQTIPTGFIPGHEFVGVIHEMGAEVKGFKIGDTVVVGNHFYWTFMATLSTQCGDCFYCERQQTSRCSNSFLFGNSAGTTGIDGGQAEFVRVPYASSTLVHGPRSIQEKLLVLMADIFPTGYFCASRFLKSLPREVAKSSVIAVVGCGPVGICAIAVALTWCDNVFAIDMVPERLAEAERLGAKPLLLTEVPAAVITVATDGRGADVVLEVVGTLDAMRLCINLVRPFGSISSVGVLTGELSFDGPTLYAKNVTIAWGHCPVRGIFEDALSCLSELQDKVAFLCDREVSIEYAVEAYRLFNDRKVHKVLLIP